MIKQNIVFIENKAGSLQKVTNFWQKQELIFMDLHALMLRSLLFFV